MSCSFRYACREAVVEKAAAAPRGCCRGSHVGDLKAQKMHWPGIHFRLCMPGRENYREAIAAMMLQSAVEKLAHGRRRVPMARVVMESRVRDGCRKRVLE